MTAQFITTAGGERLVVLSAEEYEDLVDARDHAIAMRNVAAGGDTLTVTEMDACLAAATPLAFWRKHRGMTQAALATAAGISQPYLAQAEAGRRTPATDVCARIAKALRVRIEDLIAEG